MSTAQNEADHGRNCPRERSLTATVLPKGHIEMMAHGKIVQESQTFKAKTKHRNELTEGYLNFSIELTEKEGTLYGCEMYAVTISSADKDSVLGLIFCYSHPEALTVDSK